MAQTEDTRKDSSGLEGAKAGRPKRKSWPLVLVLLILAGGAGVLLYGAAIRGGSENTDDAKVGGQQVVVSSQSLERVKSLAAAEGDRVAKGQALVRMDEGAMEVRKSKAEANAEYAAKSAELAELKLDQARSDLDRASLQFQGKIISQEQYDHINQACQAAKASLDIARAQARVAEAELRGSVTDIERSTLASPVDGVVARRWVAEGEIVQPAQAIYTICDLDELWIEANFKETQIRVMKPGDPASFTVDAFPGKVFTGKVESVGATTASAFALVPQDSSAGNFTKMTQRVPVRLSINREPGRESSGGIGLRPGLSVEVRVLTGRE